MLKRKFGVSKLGSLQNVITTASGVKVTSSNNNVYDLNDDHSTKTWPTRDFFTMLQLRKDQFDRSNALKHTSGATIDTHAMSWPHLTTELNQQ